jgi:hypothetical protein
VINTAAKPHRVAQPARAKRLQYQHACRVPLRSAPVARTLEVEVEVQDAAVKSALEPTPASHTNTHSPASTEVCFAALAAHALPCTAHCTVLCCYTQPVAHQPGQQMGDVLKHWCCKQLLQSFLLQQLLVSQTLGSSCQFTPLCCLPLLVDDPEGNVLVGWTGTENQDACVLAATGVWLNPAPTAQHGTAQCMHGVSRRGPSDDQPPGSRELNALGMTNRQFTETSNLQRLMPMLLLSLRVLNSSGELTE